MTSNANTIEEYIAELPEERKEVVQKLREVILANLPEGFSEEINYGMIDYVVPLSLYPDGYHCDPKLPLPFASVASQKSHIAVYHSGVYAIPELSDWFKSEYPKYVKTKLDMGKSCIRFKNIKNIPYKLIGELFSKLSPEEWIKHYESNIKN